MVTAVLLCILGLSVSSTYGSFRLPARYLSEEKRAYACENSRLFLDCKVGIIRIQRANYGRFSYSVCNQYGVINTWDVKCLEKESTRIVSERCDGHQNCTVDATNEMFGDPCKGTYKYLQADYKCEALPTTTSTTTTTRPTTVTTTKAPATTTTTATTTEAKFCPEVIIENVVWPATKSGEHAVIPCPDPRDGMRKWKCRDSEWFRFPDESNCVSPSNVKVTTTTPSKPESETSNKSPQYCPEVEMMGVFWGLTRVGESAERPCRDPQEGMMTWRCRSSGWVGKPDTTKCVSPWMKAIKDQWNSSKDVLNVADTLSKDTSSRAMGAGELLVTTDLISMMNDALDSQIHDDLPEPIKYTTLQQFANDIAKTGSNLLSPLQASSWEELPSINKTSVAASFLVSMETTGIKVAENIEKETSILSTNDNLLMEVSAVKISQKSTVTYPSASVGRFSSDKITFPMESLRAVSTGGMTKVIVLVYQNMSHLMKTDHGATVINSNILSASLMTRETTTLKKPVTFTLRLQESNSSLIPVCSFWNHSDLSWSSDGCWRLDHNETHATCQCSHLTNFAVLMDVKGTKLSVEHELALMSITYVGCIISIICLLASFITFCYFKNLQCDRNTIHKNLVLCLMLAELVFVIGIAMTKNRILCAVIAGLLHFLFLASFAWMCLEGMQLYVMLIQVFEAERSRKKWFYMFGYGVPLVIVVVTAAVRPTGLGTDKYCWLQTDSAVIWSFVGPALAVIAINIVMLSIAVYKMYKHSNILSTSRGKEKSHFKSVSQDPSSGSSSGTANLTEEARARREMPAWIKGSAVLVVLLGLTWAFGVMFINEDSVIMAYIFTVLNSFQGLFIFVFHCIMNEKVKKEYKKFAYKSTWLPDCLRGYCIGYTSPTTHSPNNSSSSGGYLLKFWSGKRRRKSSSSTLDRASKNKKRQSDPRSDTSVFTSQDMNDGYLIPKKQNGHTQTNGIMKSHLEHEAMLGDLSIADCSVIDSEFVSEYCQKNMQVSNERKGYSSDSEEEPVECYEKNRLSVLSEDSDVKNMSDFKSSQNIYPGSLEENELLIEKTVSEKNLINQTERSQKNFDDFGKMLYPGSVGEIHMYLSSGEELNHSMPHIRHTQCVVVNDSPQHLSSSPELQNYNEKDNHIILSTSGDGLPHSDWSLSNNCHPPSYNSISEC